MSTQQQIQMNQQEFLAERSYKFQKHSLLVDSNARDRTRYPSSSSYRIELPSVYKQVKTVKLMSAEVPMTFYSLTSANASTTLKVGVYNDSAGSTKLATQTVQIPDGNYTNSTLVASFASKLNANTFFQSEGLTFGVSVDLVSGLISFMTTPERKVYVDATTDTGLSYYLGFPKGQITEGTVCKASSVLRVNPYNYILLDIAEINGMDECGRSTNSVFAKVPMNTAPFETVMIAEDYSNFNTSHLNPYISKLSTLTVVWRTFDMKQIDFNGADHSFALELECLE